MDTGLPIGMKVCGSVVEGPGGGAVMELDLMDSMSWQRVSIFSCLAAIMHFTFINSSFTAEHSLHVLYDVAVVTGSLHSMLVAHSHDLKSHLGWTISTPTNII